MKIIKALVAAILLFSIIPMSYATASYDIKKPAVEHLQVDKKQATAGEVVNINLGVTNSSDYRYAILYYSSPVTNKGITIKLDYNDQTQLFEGSFPVNETVESGIYMPDMISLYNEGITTIYSYEYDGFELGSFEVIDTSGIEFIKNVTVDKYNVEKGDTVTFQLQTSSIENIRYLNAYFKSPVSNQTFTVSLYYNDETASYEGKIPVTSIMENGIYTLFMMNTYEYGGNSTIFYSRNYDGEFENGNFAVSGSDIINLVENISINKNEVTVEEKMDFTVKLADPVGINYLNLNYESPGIGYDFHVDLYFNSETGLYEGSFIPDFNFEEGEYTLSMIAVYDSSGNTTALYDDYHEFQSGDFTFYREANPPSYTGVLVDKNAVVPGEVVRVNVIAEDDTKLSEAVINYISPNTQTETPILLQYDAVEKQFFGDFYTDGESEVGTWKVDSIEIKDTNENLTAVSKEETDLSAGNFSIKDVIVPEIHSINEITDQTATISGKAEAEAVITVKNLDKKIGSTVTELDGNFSLAIDKQLAGTLLNVTATDAAGNISEAKEMVVLDVTAPQTPAVEKITDNSTVVTGVGEVDSIISVNAAGKELGTGKVATDGTYKVPIAAQKAETKIQITSMDSAGNISAAKEVIVADATPPNLPTVNEVTDKSTTVTGTTEAKTTITIKDGVAILGSATANADGTYSVTIPTQKAGTKLSVTATDTVGNVTAAKEITVLDATAPNAPTVSEVTDKSTVVTGTAEAAAHISIKAGSNELGTAIVGSEGKFSVTIAKQKDGTKLSVTATDKAGNVGAAKVVTVLDATAPTAPTVDPVTDKSTVVTGSGEVDVLISIKADSKELSTATVTSDGKYKVTIPVQKAGTKLSVTATDAAGNTSMVKEVMVTDGIAPAVPTVNEVTDQSTTVNGTAEAETLISVKAGTSVLGTTIVQADGTYSLTIPKQKSGTVLAVTATDQAGNVSEVTEIVVADGTAPALELTSKVTQHSVRAIGTAEAGAKIAIQAGTVSIGTAVADAKGDYEVTIAKQKVGTKLSIVATDAAGNSSAPLIVTVEDGNYPDLKLTHWALDEIMYLADDQIIGGYPNGGFQPEKNTTRAEAAKMLALAMDLPIENVSSVYKDVRSSHWAKDYIAAVSKAGLFNGNPDGTFAPDTVLKRAEMAKVISIAYELKASDNNHFKDVKSGYWAKGYISGLYENGITTGYPDNTFRPEESTTRAEFSVFLARALNQDFR